MDDFAYRNKKLKSLGLGVKLKHPRRVPNPTGKKTIVHVGEKRTAGINKRLRMK